MPTTRPRHTLTEDSELHEALEIAREEWRDMGATELLRRLVREGAAVVAEHQRVSRAIAAVDAASGSLPDIWNGQSLGDQSQDWPE